MFIGRTDIEAEAPILWPHDAENWVIEKGPDAGKDHRQEENGTTEDEMVGWHHQLNGHEFEQAPRFGDILGSLVCCSPWGHKELDSTERLNLTKNTQSRVLVLFLADIVRVSSSAIALFHVGCCNTRDEVSYKTIVIFHSSGGYKVWYHGASRFYVWWEPASQTKSFCKSQMAIGVRDHSKFRFVLIRGFPHSSVSKEFACYAGDPGSILGLERYPGEGNGNPLQYLCLENAMDREAWQATVYGIARVRHYLATKPLPPVRVLIPFLRALPSCPNNLPKTSPLNSTRIGHYNLTYEFWEETIRT